MAKEKMTEAEKYRIERKKRIEKEKKKRYKYVTRKHGGKNRSKIIGCIVGAVIVCAIVIGLLSFFGVFNRMITAVKIGDQKVTVAEMNCAFSDVKNQVYNTSQQYEQSYGQSFFNQDTKMTDSCIYDSSKTWGEYFEEQALEHVKQIYAFKDAGDTALTEEQSKEISDTFDTLAENAANNKFSLNAYIREIYGTGVNKTVLRTWLENVYKAQNAQTNASDEYQKSLTDEDIQEYYKENKAKYMTAEAVAYTLRVDTTDQTEALQNEELTDEEIDALIESNVSEAKKNAQSIYKEADNAAGLVDAVNAYEKETKGDSATTYEEDTLTLSGKISEKMTSLGANAQKWVADSTKAGQSDVIYSADYETKTFQFDIVFVKEPASDFNTVTVRHILIQPASTDDDASWEDAKQQIEEIYDQWKENPTEDYFAQLAQENSSDPGSSKNGGIYEDVVPGQMVDTFNDWCFDSGRKEGDTGIVKTTYGYHLMYFVSNNGAYWKTQVPKDMASEHSETSIKEQLEKFEAEKCMFGWNRIKEVKEYKSAMKTTTTTVQQTTAAAQ